MTELVPFITLSKENFAEFQRQVYDYASSICLDNGFLTHRHGLLSFVVTTAIWQNLPGNEIPDDAAPPNIVFVHEIFLLRPIFQQKTPMLGDFSNTEQKNLIR